MSLRSIRIAGTNLDKRCKLTPEQIEEIQARRYGPTYYAAKFNCSISAIKYWQITEEERKLHNQKRKYYARYINKEDQQRAREELHKIKMQIAKGDIPLTREGKGISSRTTVEESSAFEVCDIFAGNCINIYGLKDRDLDNVYKMIKTQGLTYNIYRENYLILRLA